MRTAVTASWRWRAREDEKAAVEGQLLLGLGAVVAGGRRGARARPGLTFQHGRLRRCNGGCQPRHARARRQQQRRHGALQQALARAKVPQLEAAVCEQRQQQRAAGRHGEEGGGPAQPDGREQPPARGRVDLGRHTGRRRAVAVPFRFSLTPGHSILMLRYAPAPTTGAHGQVCSDALCCRHPNSQAAAHGVQSVASLP